MKTKLFFLLGFLTFQTLFGQVSNDSCLSAIDLGTIYGDNLYGCVDGEMGFDTSTYSGNINSLANYPYISMSGCQGYTNSTATVANDVWYKFKSNNFYIKIFNASSLNSLDSIHLNVWHGTNCSNLAPSGCYTFDMVTNPFYFVSFAGDTTGGQYTYLQFSGNALGKTGNFDFCLQGEIGLPYTYSGAIVTTYTGIKHEFKKDVFDMFIYPNPATGNVYIAPIGVKCDNLQVNVTDLAGKVVYSSLLSIHEGVCNFNLKIEPGIYFVKITDCSSDEKITKKLVIQ
jgi:hypothetical protein